MRMIDKPAAVRVTLTCAEGHVWRGGYETKEAFFSKDKHPCPECGARFIGARVHGVMGDRAA
ncbi:MAG: hypothetical protein E8D47_13215 [Nitrospira sp.]|nr:MAG: hypothetical protein E8D47_13215 [Nitrospira sp.]